MTIEIKDVECTCGHRFDPKRIQWNDEGVFTWCPECSTKLNIGDSHQYDKTKKKKKDS